MLEDSKDTRSATPTPLYDQILGPLGYLGLRTGKSSGVLVTKKR